MSGCADCRRSHAPASTTGAGGPLVTQAAPRLIALPGVGPETAGQLLASTGDNPGRLRSEAAFAHLCGPPRSRRPPAAPTATGSTGAATARATTRSTPSCWSA
ncbi:transposase [Streptomyces sp. TX20-6-3]|uniref:transposase n=1 Tax=Streptomyces sp. TX20-6-3 TaxID=3028705 RepID=UPI0030185D1D